MDNLIFLIIVALIFWGIYKLIQKVVYKRRTRVGQPILIRYYKSKNAYQKDAQKLRQYGYEINDVQTIVPRKGCMWLFTFGFLRGRKPEITVTYWLTDEEQGAAKLPDESAIPVAKASANTG